MIGSASFLLNAGQGLQGWDRPDSSGDWSGDGIDEATHCPCYRSNGPLEHTTKRLFVVRTTKMTD